MTHIRGTITANAGTGTFTVGGTIAATQSGAWSVGVNNFPATQPISGSISVSNFPATQAVTGTFWQATQPVSGSISVSNFPAFPAIQPVSQSGAWTVAVNDFPAIQPVSQSGTWSVLTNKCGTSAITTVASAVTNVVLLAANANRVFAHVSNALPNKTMYIKLGAAASLTSFTDAVLTGDAYDIPENYTGIVSAIWASGVNLATALCTELTP